MKKTTAALLAALMLCAPALAMENLGGIALVGQGAIYYAGSLDGATQGVYVLDPEGAQPQMLFAGNASLLAGNDQTLLVQDLGQDAGGGLVLLSREGEELYRMGLTTSSAIEAQGRYFTGPYMLWVEDGEGCERAYIQVTEDQIWHIQPVWAQDDILYYLDETRYCDVRIEGGASVGKLMRLNLSTGESVQVSQEGTSFLGMWEGRAVYVRNNFYIYQGEETVTVDAAAGLYLEGENGGQEILLASLDQTGDLYTAYARVMDGAVYGVQVDYTQDDPPAFLKGVSLTGQGLSDISVPAGDISAAQDGCVYLCASYFIETEEVAQADRMIRVDVASGQWTQLNQQRREVLCFSEEAPRLALMGGRIYYLDFDNQRSATRLCSVDLEGADHKVLAQGYSWLNVEA